METALAILVGSLFAGGLYLLLRPSAIKLVIGLALLSHAANLLLFTAGGLVRAGVPIVKDTEQPTQQIMADPLPQAMILTAIVISFAVLAFSLTMVCRAYSVTGTDNVDAITTRGK
ncbi:MAG: Na+/H+ antiporter subunit C [Pirellulaceae bacterium]|nr:Na+/H+ antiporter subunit C [Planctomycetales bacterium]MCA9205388.1 Na+/H+ antiporter subunit C [Planctomycetales bacterium]MCA9206918.1 Na+/H+ antiporter subunit C [Planctomycetales bacterium]MCA9224479.1 Na+/H+ antiporter subunit C [Planctomycetales bacterium]